MNFQILSTTLLSRDEDIIIKYLYKIEIAEELPPFEYCNEMVADMVMSILTKTVDDNGFNEKAALGVSISSDSGEKLHLPFKKLQHFNTGYINRVFMNVGQSSENMLTNFSRKVCYFFHSL